MDGWKTEVFRSIAIGVALALAALSGLRTKAARSGKEELLRPTIFGYLFPPACGFLIGVVVYTGWGETRPNQIRWLYAFLIFMTLACVYLYWHVHLRIVYWSDEGVGVRGPLVSSRLIRWDEVKWAGRTWSGDHQIRSDHAKISFTTFDGGATDLISATKRYVPSSLVQFD